MAVLDNSLKYLEQIFPEEKGENLPAHTPGDFSQGVTASNQGMSVPVDLKTALIHREQYIVPV